MTNLRAEPAVCPACGELLIVYPAGLDTAIIPVHLDIVTPWTDCTASATLVRRDHIYRHL